MPLSECEVTITSILEELNIDCWTYKSGERPLRCTGAAITTAVGLLEATLKAYQVELWYLLVVLVPLVQVL